MRLSAFFQSGRLLSSVMVWILVAVGAVVGLVASRSLVAEIDAHRSTGGDRWSQPLCDFCGALLSPTMLRCQGTARHPQRLTNLFVLVATPVLIVACLFVVPTWWLWPAFAVYSVVLLLLAVTDLDTKLIPNRILGPGTVVAAMLLVIGWLFAMESGSILRAIGGAAAYFVAMYVLAIIARGALGFGDVKLAFLIGLFTGYLGWGEVVVAGVGGFILGGVVSVVLLLSGRFGRKDAIPFGPFMIVAGLVAAFWGPSIVAWYAG